jgi:cytochrome c oxidase subunit II
MRTRHSKALIFIGFFVIGLFFTMVYLHAQESVRVIQVHAKRFSFTPSEITLQKGETVKLVLTSEDVPHALVIPELNVKQEVSKGHPAEVTIVADKAGDFHGMCGHFCGTGHGSMLFTVHVKDK